MSKIVMTMSGPIETDYPADAICAFDGCGHEHEVHSYASNCGHCSACDRSDGVIDWHAFHYFKPVLLAGGAASASQERELYERAMRGEA